jgi:hypothetical protein
VIVPQVKVTKKRYFRAVVRQFILRVHDERRPRVISEFLPRRTQWLPEPVLAQVRQAGVKRLPGTVESVKRWAWRRIPLPVPDLQWPRAKAF